MNGYVLGSLTSISVPQSHALCYDGLNLRGKTSVGFFFFFLLYKSPTLDYAVDLGVPVQRSKKGSTLYP